MKCNEIQEALSLYSDDGLTPAARAACYQHLEECPVCRARLAELRAIRRNLAVLPRPSLPPDLIPSINTALIAEAVAQRARHQTTLGDIVSGWLQPWVARYAFSSLASLLLFSCVFAALRPHMVALHEAALALNDSSIATEAFESQQPGFDINKPISPEGYAALRTPYNAESPSLNPGGALATLAWSPGHMRHGVNESDDDMIVVADVFSNGSASLADVMHAPRDRHMLESFQRALQQDAAFVPSALDRRAGTMRVVFSVQRVDVHERDF
jgi:hypothetical protein